MEWLCLELRAALQEIDRLENDNLGLRENVDLLRREKAAFVDRVKQLEEKVAMLKSGYNGRP
jgi:phage shock protein A